MKVGGVSVTYLCQLWKAIPRAMYVWNVCVQVGGDLDKSGRSFSKSLITHLWKGIPNALNRTLAIQQLAHKFSF